VTRYLTDLATAARASGLRVVEVAGWESRGHGPMVDVRGVVCHHTGTPASAAGDYPTMRVVRDGRSDLPGPLANLGLGRDGTVYVIAAGLCYHAGAVLRPEYGNGHTIGIEAEHPGHGEWPAGQYDAYVALVRALVAHYGLTPSDVRGHREVCAPVGRKDDPTFAMAGFRARLTPAGQEEHMPLTDDDAARVVRALLTTDPNLALGGSSHQGRVGELLLWLVARQQRQTEALAVLLDAVHALGTAAGAPVDTAAVSAAIAADLAHRLGDA